jgi:hypothetical protein
MPQRPSAPKGGVGAWLDRFSHLAIVRLVVFVVVLIAALVASKLVSNPFVPERRRRCIRRPWRWRTCSLRPCCWAPTP